MLILTRIACGYRLEWRAIAEFTPADLAWFRSPIREGRS